MRAVIIGGGIAGTVTAIALGEAGIDATVYEAYDHAADGVGSWLSLAVNGLDALSPFGLDRTVREAGFDTPRMALLSGTGKVLADFPNGTALPNGTVGQTIRRADLYAALRDETLRRGIPIEYGKRLIAAEQTARCGVVARFEDGTQAEGDLLVGADGLQSRVRRIIDPAAPSARYVGLLNTGGYARGVEAAGAPGTLNFVFGKRCFLGYVRHPDGAIWWFANPPSARELSRAELAAITPEEWRARLLDLFADDVVPAAAIIRNTPELAPAWNTYDFPSVPTWRNGRMVIIGDAAHAASPASGQGASMAFEDAVVLAKCLRDCPDVATAFATYERLRRPRVERVVAQGKRNGNQKAAGPVGRVLRDLLMPPMLRMMTRSGKMEQPWLYDYHIAWDAPVEAATRAA